MDFWNSTFKIGSKDIPRSIGGPMDGFTDSPFRAMVRQFSPRELLYTEITHAATLVHAAHTSNILRFEPIERPLNFQVTVNSTEPIERACGNILLAGVDMVDLNIGCPARTIIGSGSGSALMADIPRLKIILRKFRRFLPIPFTVKMRAGFKERNACDVALLAQDEGVDALVVHPRLQKQKFTGVPDYSLVKQIKKQLSIPVIVSGGIVDAESARLIHEWTGADGLMVSRALCGAPWKLKELQETIEGRDYCIRSDMILDVALCHLTTMLDYYGLAGLYMFRKHLASYVKNGENASEFRHKLMTEDSVESVREGLCTFFRARSE